MTATYDHEVSRARVLRAQGLTFHEIAERQGVTVATAYRRVTHRKVNVCECGEIMRSPSESGLCGFCEAEREGAT